MAEPKLPAPFEGATHRHSVTGNCVRAVQWNKDGDHPMVERYPIEKRAYKGLLVLGRKDKFALYFGDWIVEDEDGRIFVVSGVPREATEFVEAQGKGFGDPAKVFHKVVRALPSVFDERYRAITGSQS